MPWALLLATSLGTVVIDRFGFASLGALAAATGLLGAVLSILPIVARSDAAASPRG
jgi:predicted MFS family arabinose efflux permease